jgi:alpha-ketoglutarate-dependent taurine dioxygenase
MDRPAMTAKPLPFPGPRGRSLARDALVHLEPLRADRPLPLVIRPAVDGLDPSEWARDHGEDLERLLLVHGGILFRGFGVRDPEGLERLVTAVSAGLLEYRERSSPRTHVGNRVYTSTEHPADQPIFFHNEQSYNLTFPLRIVFACAVAATEGGATPIADVREVYRRIDPDIRRRFEQEGYTYVRNFGDGFGLPWEEVFQTEDRAVVNEYCHRNRIDVEWKDDKRLRTRQVRRAVARHPRSGAVAWFNHATFFHRTTLDATVRVAFEAAFREEDEFPNNTLYGDGTPIDPDVVEELRQAYRDCTVTFTWQVGDVLMLDNMLAAHAREPYRGPRRILTAMADPFSWDDIAP